MAGNLISSNEIRTGDANRSAKINPVSDDGEESDLEEGGIKSYSPQIPSVQYIKKVAAELIGTFFLMFLGYASIVNDKKSDGSSTHLGVSLVWGLTLMVLIYSLGHISGGHFNPAVTLAFATVRRFPLKDVIGFMASQFVGSISAGFALRFLLGEEVQMAATVPTGSDMQSLLVEFLITFLLMFVICSVATDTRAIGELAGLAVGATIAVAVITVGPISGASLNPARTVGSALAGNIYTSIWIYFVGPIVGATAGAWSYDMLRLNDEPVRELTRSGSFLRSRRCF